MNAMKRLLTPTNRSLFPFFSNLNRLESDFDEFHRLSSLPWREDRHFMDFSPTCDFKETEANMIFSFDIPGMKKKDIKIQVNDND